MKTAALLKIPLTAIFGLTGMMAAAQDSLHLSLPQAIALAREHFPLNRQNAVLAQQTALQNDNAAKNFLPQVNLGAQASYQSEVTQVSIPLPGVTINPLSKDQYKLTTDISQLVYDGGLTREQQKLQQAGLAVEQQKTEVELFKLTEQVNQAFLGILLLNEQLKQTELVKNDLQNGLKKTEVLVNNGVAFRSNADAIRAELLKNEQRRIELQASRSGLVNLLGVLLNQSIPANTVFEKPVPAITSGTGLEKRPELKLFSLQNELVSEQLKWIDRKNQPRASLFVQGGYGRPGLNFLKNEFSPFFIGGVRLNWQLGNLYTRKNEKQNAELNRKLVTIQQQVFEQQVQARLTQQQAEINKLQQLIAADRDIITLRENIKKAASAQLSNGVITANDFLREVNAEDLARQTRITHELQLLQAQINYQTLLGKTP